MMRQGLAKLSGALCLIALAQPIHAERLSLSFLPPDLPPSNVCDAEPEVREDDELQDADIEVVPPGDVVLEDEERVRFIIRDIETLSAENAAEWSGYIEALIDWRAEIDPGFTDIDASFARAELLIKAGRRDLLKARGTIAALAEQSGELSNTQKVTLARYLRAGLGIEKKPALADALLVEAGFEGSSGALLALLRRAMVGDPVEGWDLGLEETATLAFGGVVGQMNRGLCGRAERMAREYLNGDILEPNEELAYAWRVFAADMGGARAAWRVVEHHLNGTAPRSDDATLLHYLTLAVAGGVEVSPSDAASLLDSGATTKAELRKVLARSTEVGSGGSRHSAARYLELQVNPIVDGFAAESDLSRYLEEAIAIPGAPGSFHRRLAQEVLVRQGQWAGEARARALLEEAVQRGDVEAKMHLADLQSRYRDDPRALGEAEQLLLDAVTRDAHAPAMRALDHFYRCRLPDAPHLSEAEFWSSQYRASGAAAVSVSPSDVAKMHARLEPDAVAKLQSFALRDHAASKANLLQILQSDPLASVEVLRYWAGRVASSDSALEEFVDQEFELASTVGERERAVSLFRRAYMDVGQSISLDLAVTLVEHAGRDPETAKEVRGLLERSARRGEGAAIRLLQRLTDADPQVIYETYATVIERRGDFLGLMFAAPHVSDDVFADYMDRAVSVMNCGTKDVSELADAYAARGMTDEAGRWLQVGLALEGGNVLSKLGLTDRQGELFDTGLPQFVVSGDDAFSQLRAEYLGVSDPLNSAFDASAAAGQLVQHLQGAEPEVRRWALTQVAVADVRVRRAVSASIDLVEVFEKAAEEGDVRAQYELGMYLRHEAEAPQDLTTSADWLLKAAEAGRADAMAEYGFALGFGLGIQRDVKLALIWLQKAQGLGNQRARELARMLRALDVE
ncbi:tetratricopeptide repeat protein [Boseongicola aestuarii]|uniref:Sel1 repeat protein n=1 Tax=Boseongicola aestuarii TaxID=1470561 RepID=A0A238J063_9RHOB|nr:tetratricopeptide repeat protein [Boseongicola aestuarii]SMX24017.1 Sel1 repeat protein [Boseongicola aestuarii]